MEYVFSLFLALAILIPVILYYVLRYVTIKIKLNVFLILPIISAICWFFAFLTFFKLVSPEMTLNSVLLVLPRTGMTTFVIIPLIIISIITTLIGFSKYRKLRGK
jgi:hypothetical protein